MTIEQLLCLQSGIFGLRHGHTCFTLTCLLLQPGVCDTGHFYALGSSISSELDSAVQTHQTGRHSWHCACPLQLNAAHLLLFLQSGIFGTGHFYALGSSISSELDAAESTDASDRKAWLIIAYILAGCTAILILLTLLMMRRVKVTRCCLTASQHLLLLSCMG